jgi:hypothetical protein
MAKMILSGEGVSAKNRVIVSLTAVTLALLLLVVMQASPRPAYAASDRLPDLGMAHPQGPRIEITSDGRKLLRFSSIVVNVGAGPFELHGQRASGASTMDTTQQRVFDSDGGYRDVPTEAKMIFGGDGHNHWHVQNLEDFELVRLDNGTKVGTGVKQGFCFFDNYLYGSSEPAFYTRANSCAGGRSADQTRMGLSVGWGDKYGRTLPDQYIDITGLTPGNYRLLVTADADKWFLESNDSNNTTWIDIKLRANNTVGIVAYGPRP